MAVKKTQAPAAEEPKNVDLEDDDDVEAMGRGVARRKGVKTKSEKRREFANWCANNKYASQEEVTRAFKEIVG